jgi:hypothetical protein
LLSYLSQLINDKKKAKSSKYTNSGVLSLRKYDLILTQISPQCFVRFELVKEVSFIEYLKSGLEMNFTVAVDFTGSNGWSMGVALGV